MACLGAYCIYRCERFRRLQASSLLLNTVESVCKHPSLATLDEARLAKCAEARFAVVQERMQVQLVPLMPSYCNMLVMHSMGTKEEGR